MSCSLGSHSVEISVEPILIARSGGRGASPKLRLTVLGKNNED